MTTPDDDLIERVARAIEPDTFFRWDQLARSYRSPQEGRKCADFCYGAACKAARDKARRAIGSMRNPTEAMIEEFWKHDHLSDEKFRTAWNAAIDAALVSALNPAPAKPDGDA